MSELNEVLDKIDGEAKKLYPNNYTGVGLLNASAENDDDDKPWIAWINSKNDGVIEQVYSNTALKATTELLEKLLEIPERQEPSD